MGSVLLNSFKLNVVVECMYFLLVKVLLVINPKSIGHFLKFKTNFDLFQLQANIQNFNVVLGNEYALLDPTLKQSIADLLAVKWGKRNALSNVKIVIKNRDHEYQRYLKRLSKLARVFWLTSFRENDFF